VPQGEASLVLGPSGSGKSTLLAILAGLLAPREGDVTVADARVSALSPRERDRFRARNVGIVLQKLHLINVLSVRDNLRIARRLAGLADDDAHTARRSMRSASRARLAPGRVALGGRSAARGDRACRREPPARDPRRRADGRPRRCELRQGARAPSRPGGRMRATLVVATHDRRVADRFDERSRCETCSASRSPTSRRARSSRPCT
jgi:putative ABC transport system ATP-binding protein